MEEEGREEDEDGSGLISSVAEAGVARILLTMHLKSLPFIVVVVVVVGGGDDGDDEGETARVAIIGGQRRARSLHKVI